MSNPLVGALNNIYTNNLQANPQWNANGGIFGLDPLTNTAYVGVTRTPSFFGASIYNSSGSSFSARITPALVGNGSTQTSLLLKKDENNFVEMYVGPNNNFGGYVSNNNNVTTSSSAFPTYNASAHAYWRIRNGGLQFYFETSPDGSTWTTLGGAPYQFDASAVTVMFLAGYNGSEDPQTKAYISNINGNIMGTNTSGSVYGTASVRSSLKVTQPITLSGTVSGFSTLRSKLSLVAYLPEGGLTDFAVVNTTTSPITNGIDPVQMRILNKVSNSTVSGGTTRTWKRAYSTSTMPTYYRDNSYWKAATGMSMDALITDPDNNVSVMSSAQVESFPAQTNKLSLNAAYYTDSCEYVANQALDIDFKENRPLYQTGVSSVTRSRDVTQAGNYAGKVVFSGIAVPDGAGNSVYYPLPTRNALAPVVQSPTGALESFRGSVSLSTVRAGTKWYPALLLFDSSFNLLDFSDVFETPPAYFTHPGGGVWQTASTAVSSSLYGQMGVPAWAAVVPVVIAANNAPETVYMSGHNITSTTPDITASPTAYVDPQQLSIELKADRVNLAKNSGFSGNLDGWGSYSLGTPDVQIYQDYFSRSIPVTQGGWGSPDAGGNVWSVVGTITNYYVASGRGKHVLPAVNSADISIVPAPSANVDMYVETSSSFIATGNYLYTGLTARYIDNSNRYLARLEFNTNQSVALTINKRVAGVETTLLASQSVFPPGSYTAFKLYSLRFQVIGSCLRAKVWLTGTAEPGAWTASIVDTSLNAVGNVGMISAAQTGNTNTFPLDAMNYDNFHVFNVPSPLLGEDTFTNRYASSSWGTADVGGTWQQSGGSASDYSTVDQYGSHNMTTLNVNRTTYLTAPSADMDVYATLELGVSTPTGASVFGGIVLRRQDANNYYYARVEFTTTAQVNMALIKVVGGVSTTLNSISNIPTVPGYSLGLQYFRVRFAAVGNTLLAKVWSVGAGGVYSIPEPQSWKVFATDSSLTSAGSYGMQSITATGNTDSTHVMFYSTIKAGTANFVSYWDSTVGFNSVGSMKTTFYPASNIASSASVYTGPASHPAMWSIKTFPIITGLQVGTTYTVSCYVYQGAGCPDVLVNLLDANGGGVYNISVNNVKTSTPSAVIGGWTRVSFQFTVPSSGAEDYRLWFSIPSNTVTTTFSFWVDSILVEKGSQLFDYFDGNFSSPDYSFEKFGNFNNRSYYYKDLTNKLARVNQIIPTFAPLGSTATVLYAQSP